MRLQDPEPISGKPHPGIWRRAVDNQSLEAEIDFRSRWIVFYLDLTSICWTASTDVNFPAPCWADQTHQPPPCPDSGHTPEQLKQLCISRVNVFFLCGTNHSLICELWVHEGNVPSKLHACARTQIWLNLHAKNNICCAQKQKRQKVRQKREYVKEH